MDHNFLGTRPGKTIKREQFSVTFNGVLASGDECRYDWTPVMNLFLNEFDKWKALEDLEKIEIEIKDALSSWFLTYPGWDLFYSLLQRETKNEFTRILRSVQQVLRLSGEDDSYQTCWQMVTQDIYSPLSSSMADLLPNIDVTLMEGDFGGEAGRSKGLVLRLGGNRNLDIQFVVEKQRKSRVTLLDISLEAVARNIRKDLAYLEIPTSLYTPLRDAWQDYRWLSTARTGPLERDAARWTHQTKLPDPGEGVGIFPLPQF